MALGGLARLTVEIKWDVYVFFVYNAAFEWTWLILLFDFIFLSQFFLIIRFPTNLEWEDFKLHLDHSRSSVTLGRSFILLGLTFFIYKMEIMASELFI